MLKTETTNWKSRFFTIWTGQQLSLIGSAMASFALVWWVTKTTGSATILATASMVALLPNVLLAPFVGAYVDRHDRQRIMLLADAFVALVSLWLGYLFWSGAMQIWHVYVVMLARSVGGTFHWPAMQASTSLMVPEEHLPRVSGANSTVQGLLNVVAPPLGAFLLAILPLHGIMWIDVATAGFAIAPLLFVRIPQPVRAATSTNEPWSILSDVKGGFRYILGWPGLTAILIMALVINLVLSPAFTLLPILVTKSFGGGALELGWANSAWGAGAVLGGILLSAWGGFKRRMMTSLLGLLGLGIGCLAIGIAPAQLFGLLLAGMFAMGFMNPITNGPLHATVQAKVRPEMQGRVFTVMQSVAGAMMPLGLAIAGPLADALGVQFWFVIGAVVCIGMSVAGALMPAVINMDKHVHPEDEAPAASTESVLLDYQDRPVQATD